MIRSVLYLTPRNGDLGKLVDYFRENRVLEVAADFPGCLSAELHIPNDTSEPAMVTALWSTEQAYANWVAFPWRANSGTGIHTVLAKASEGEAGGKTYRVEISVTANNEHQERSTL